MNQMLAIYNSDGKIFSTLKTFNPKMVNSMKNICEEYNRIFAPTTFKVCRLVKTQKGWKRI